MKSNHSSVYTTLASLKADFTETKKILFEETQEIKDLLAGDCEVVFRRATRAAQPSASVAAVMPAVSPPPSSVTTTEYCMNMGIVSVTVLWDEYTVVVNGNPSIRFLNASFGSAWRKRDTERKFYARRKPIYDLVERESRGVSDREQEIVSRLEEVRKSRKISLHKLATLVSQGESLL